jgi:CRISPR-associated protein Csd2
VNRLLENAFEIDRSASRGEMAVRGLWLFEHNTELGNAPSHKVFSSIDFSNRPKEGWTPRSFTEYLPYLQAPQDGEEILPGVRAWKYV